MTHAVVDTNAEVLRQGRVKLNWALSLNLTADPINAHEATSPTSGPHHHIQKSHVSTLTLTPADVLISPLAPPVGGLSDGLTFFRHHGLRCAKPTESPIMEGGISIPNSHGAPCGAGTPSRYQ